MEEIPAAPAKAGQAEDTEMAGEATERLGIQAVATQD